jgi:hypothetical protein
MWEHPLQQALCQTKFGALFLGCPYECVEMPRILPAMNARRFPAYLFVLFTTLIGLGAVSAGGLFENNSIEHFSEALAPVLSGSEKAKVETTLRGFYLRADIFPRMDDETEPSENGIYLNVAVRDAEEIPAFTDVTVTKDSISTRTVEFTAPKGSVQGLRIYFVYGKDAPEGSLAAIRASIAKLIKASKQGSAEKAASPVKGK